MSNLIPMLLSYIRLSLRLLARNPFFTAINIFGLAVGFCCFFILWPFTQSELKADQFIKDHDRISRIVIDWNWTDDGGASWGHMFISGSGGGVTSDLFLEGHLESYTRYVIQEKFKATFTNGLGPDLVVSIDQSGNDMLFVEKGAICADPNLFEFFDLPLVSGERKTALANPDAVVLSESAAKKYFGDMNVMYRVIRVNKTLFTITGVFRDIPSNSHLEFDMVFSNSGRLHIWNTLDDNTPWAQHYIKPKHPGDNINEILTRYANERLAEVRRKIPHVKPGFFAQPLDDIAYSVNYTGDRFQSKSKFTYRVLAMVSITVLIMAWMNYLNLTISRTKTRFKDIAARKIAGAQMKDLFLLFLCQATVVNSIAILVGATLIQLLKQPFKDLFQITTTPLWDLDANTIVFFCAIFLMGILIIAIYFTASAFKFTVSQLNQSGKNRIPAILTTMQYTTAFVLISLMLVSHFQLQFIMSKDLGIVRESVVVIDCPRINVDDNRLERMQELGRQISMALNTPAALSGNVSGDIPFNFEIRRLGAAVSYGLDSYGGVDENFVPLYGLKLIAGRNFQQDEKINGVLLSQFATERLGFRTPADAVGTTVQVDLNGAKVEVIGVFADYRVRSFVRTTGGSEDETGRGQCLSYLTNTFPLFVPHKISLKLKPGQLDEFKTKVSSIYKNLMPGSPFSWQFLDGNINRHYQSQEVARNQLSFFTLVALGIACLGLLGMIANRIVDKTKEMSIRKIIGASHINVIALLVNSTLRQVVIAIVVGLPIALLVSKNYLSGFVEQIELEWWYYFAPVCVMVMLMIATIASVVWKAVITNPVEALKHD